MEGFRGDRGEAFGNNNERDVEGEILGYEKGWIGGKVKNLVEKIKDSQEREEKERRSLIEGIKERFNDNPAVLKAKKRLLATAIVSMSLFVAAPVGAKENSEKTKDRVKVEYNYDADKAFINKDREVLVGGTSMLYDSGKDETILENFDMDEESAGARKVLKNGIRGENMNGKLNDFTEQVKNSRDYAALVGAVIGVEEVAGKRVEDVLDAEQKYMEVYNRESVPFEWNSREFESRKADLREKTLAKLAEVNFDEKNVSEFAPVDGVFYSEYYKEGDGADEDAQFAIAERHLEGDDGKYFDMSRALSDAQKENLYKMLGMNAKEVNERKGIVSLREECGQIGIWFAGEEEVEIENYDENGTTVIVEKGSEKKVIKRKVEKKKDIEKEETIEDEDEDEDKDKGGSSGGGEKPVAQVIQPKNAENERRIVENSEKREETKGKVIQIPSGEIDKKTEKPGASTWEHQSPKVENHEPERQQQELKKEINEKVGDKTGVPMSTGNNTKQEAAQAERAQEQANKNEDVTPMSDAEFEKFMQDFQK